MFSFWERKSLLRDPDWLVIGSGIVGLNTAIRLRNLRPRDRIMVVERGAMPEGASTRNAGFACFGSVSELLDDLQTMPEKEVWNLVERRFRGLETLRARVGDHRLKYEPLGGFEIFRTHESLAFDECCAQIDDLNRQMHQQIGLKNVYRVVENNFGFKGILPNLIQNTAEGQLNTGEMMANLLKMARQKKIEIWNGIEIQQIDDNGAKVRIDTGGGAFFAKKVVVATNGFARKLLPNLDVQPARNQVLVTKPIKNLQFRGAFHYEKGYFYFRNVGKNQILIGGGRNLDKLGEATDQFGETPLIRSSLVNLLQEVIVPDQKVDIEFAWSGILGLGSETKSPIIRHVSPHVVAAVRMGGMGVAIGSLVGDEAANLIAEKVN